MLYLPLATVVSRRLWRIIGGFIDDAVLGQCLDVVSGDSYDDYLTAYVPQNLSCSFEYDDVSQELEVRVCKYCKSRKYREEPVSMVPRVARVRAGQRAGFIDSHSGIVVDGELMLLVKEQCVDLDVVAYPRMGR
tara:strand:- start:868 stop:1269 length:402 start_codon:yes stop_codon:yes gene_type:complete